MNSVLLLIKDAFVLQGESNQRICPFDSQLSADIGAMIFDRAVVDG